MLKGKHTDVWITPFNFPCILLIVSRKTAHTRNKLVEGFTYSLHIDRKNPFYQMVVYVFNLMHTIKTSSQRSRPDCAICATNKTFTGFFRIWLHTHAHETVYLLSMNKDMHVPLLVAKSKAILVIESREIWWFSIPFTFFLLWPF